MSAPETSPGTRARDGAVSWRTILFLFVAPVVLVGPSLLPGRRFLPLHPVAFEPLASEYPAAAERASRGANLLTPDRILPFLTDQLEVRRQVLSGVLPTWEPKLGLGVPLLGGSIVAPLYPPNLLALALPPDLAAGWLALAGLLVGGIGVFVLARERGLSVGAGLVGLAAFQTAGWAVANLHYPMKVDAAVWLPWSLWAVERLLRGRRLAPLALTLFTALGWLAGFVPIALFSTLAAAVWLTARALGRSAPGGPRALLVGLCALGLGVGASGPQLLPSAEASAQSVRQGQSAERVAAQALPLAVSASLVVPDLFGGPLEFTPAPHPVAAWLADEEDRDRLVEFNALEWNAFAGCTVLVLALVALVATPRRAALPALLLLATWAFAQGWPAMRFLYTLPGLGAGAPGRALALQWFLWPWLAALGTDALMERRPRALPTLLAAAFAASAGAFLAWSGFDAEAWADELVGVLAQRFELSSSEVAARFPESVRSAAAEDLAHGWARLFGAACALFAAGLCALFLRRAPQTFGAGPPAWMLVVGLGIVLAAYAVPIAATRAAPLALPLLFALFVVVVALRPRESVTLAGWLPLALALGLEGIGHGEAHVRPRRVETALVPQSDALAAVERAAGDGRVARLDESPGEAPAEVLALARPNLLEPYGISDLTPYMVFTPRTLVELVTAADPRARYRSGISRIPGPELLDHPVLDLARVTCVLSVRPVEHPRLELEHAQAGFHVYRRTGVPPAVHVVREALEVETDAEALELLGSGTVNPAETVVLAPGLPADFEAPVGFGAREGLRADRVGPSRFDVHVESTTGGWLVFHDQFYPGWKAVLDGEDVELLRVNHALRAVRVPAGEHSVRTKYEPWSLRIGALLAVLCLGLAAGFSGRAARWAHGTEEE